MNDVPADRPSSLPLYLMPAAEVTFFFAAVYVVDESPLLSVLLIVLGALALSMSLHMSYHEVAHRSSAWPNWRRFLTGLFLTPLVGLSFHGYRLSHWNHHRYNNGLRDFTTTWTQRDNVPRPKNIVWYCLSWPKVFVEASKQFKIALAEGDADIRILLWSNAESLLQLTWIVVLGIYSTSALYLYLGLVFIGWVFVSLHNYGQHLPIDYDDWYRTTSYTGPWYNRLTFNNGLHYEHHAASRVPIADLHADEAAVTVSVPHLLAPFANRT